MSAEPFYVDSSQYRLAYLYASPLIDTTGMELPLLDTQQEISILKNCMKEANRLIHFKVDVATPQNLRTIATLGAVMIQYSGHGIPGILAFENGRGEVHRLDADSLKTLFSAGGVQTKIVFVSACHSEAAGRKFVEAGVPHVIAVNNRVSDSSSRIFAQNLYFSLFRGKTVQESFEIASNMVMVTEGGKPTDQKKFLLLPEDGAHDTIIFENALHGHYVDETNSLAPNGCDPTPKYFIGRKRLMQQVFFCLGVSNNRCVTIRGDRGIGKTAIACRSCEYMNERRLFDVIYFVPLRRRGASPDDDANALATVLASCMGSAGEGVGCIEGLIQALTGGRRELKDIRNPGCTNRNNGLGTRRHGDSRREDRSDDGKCKRVLFVIDGADDFVSSSVTPAPTTSAATAPDDIDRAPTEDAASVTMTSDEAGSRRYGLITLLAEVLRRTENVKFLITSSNRLAGGNMVWQLNEPEKVISVAGLSNRHSAELLVKLAPRGLLPSEMNSDNPAVALDTLAARPVVQALGGHPRALAMFASFLSDRVLDDSPEMNDMAKEVLKKAQEWREEFDPDSAQLLLPSNSTHKDDCGRFESVPAIPVAVPVSATAVMRRDHPGYPTVSATTASTVSTTPTKAARAITDCGVRHRDTSDIQTANSRSRKPTRAASSASPSLHHPRVASHSPLIAPSLLHSSVSSSALNIDSSAGRVSGRNGNAVGNLEHSHSQPNLRTASPWERESAQFSQTVFASNSRSSRSDVYLEEARSVAREVISDPVCAEVWARVSAVNNGCSPPLTSVRWTSLISALSESLEAETRVTINGGAPQSGDEDNLVSVTLSRRLTREEAKFLGVRMQLSGARVVSGKGRQHGRQAAVDYMIDRERFIVFCEEWWSALLNSLRILNAEFSCKDPIIIHGFLSRQRSEERLLETNERGVFLFRFSESRKGYLVVSFTDYATDSTGQSSRVRDGSDGRAVALRAHHCLVNVEPSGLSMYFEDGECKYDSLEELVMKCTGLRTLYPDIPKDEAFNAISRFRT
mmetsp:Transcript_16859/g.25367  ORF Transcript_16859/g.25367 Transcript_16859/m.25367 type:complete len:1026 (+) Transcript_16859:137-3214(+)|eukprot:CAMPEP_0185039802 /NCGR_PEP_ID=MMETSP1103-20130426/37093_1 /TAXON_ID=36769 /ORGANISM="Paraphysomonas bandaiensis, Strain Caron Lab Isolate" /LENGTH=1025 /DNA_ID=CAMNT_0027578845 /DNA_START=84 /DNA_END=3164 /DNA_ORIENTATION=+